MVSERLGYQKFSRVPKKLKITWKIQYSSNEYLKIVAQAFLIIKTKVMRQHSGLYCDGWWNMGFLLYIWHYVTINIIVPQTFNINEKFKHHHQHWKSWQPYSRTTFHCFFFVTSRRYHKSCRWLSYWKNNTQQSERNSKVCWCVRLPILQ